MPAELPHAQVPAPRASSVSEQVFIGKLSGSSRQVVNEEQDNMAGFDFVHLRSAPVVLANGPAFAGFSNQSGEGDRISNTYLLCA